MRVPSIFAKSILRVLAVLAVIIVSHAGAQAQEGFQSPSGNIHCMLEDNTTLRCDMRQANNAQPPKPASCEFDWGLSFVITHDGQAGERVCASDTVANDQWPVLQYGNAWQGPGFACQADTTGVTCVNTHRHGFILSKGSQELF